MMAISDGYIITFPYSPIASIPEKMTSSDKWPGEVVRISCQETEEGLRLSDDDSGPLLVGSSGNLTETIASYK